MLDEDSKQTIGEKIWTQSSFVYHALNQQWIMVSKIPFHQRETRIKKPYYWYSNRLTVTISPFSTIYFSICDSYTTSSTLIRIGWCHKNLFRNRKIWWMRDKSNLHRLDIQFNEVTVKYQLIIERMIMTECSDTLSHIRNFWRVIH